MYHCNFSFCNQFFINKKSYHWFSRQNKLKQCHRICTPRIYTKAICTNQPIRLNLCHIITLQYFRPGNNRLPVSDQINSTRSVISTTIHCFLTWVQFSWRRTIKLQNHWTLIWILFYLLSFDFYMTLTSINLVLNLQMTLTYWASFSGTKVFFFWKHVKVKWYQVFMDDMKTYSTHVSFWKIIISLSNSETY